MEPTGFNISKRVFLILLFALTGCGYTTDSLMRTDISSIYLGYFANDTGRHGLEVDLRRALAREITLHSGLSLAGRENADSIIEGEIRSYNIRSEIRTTQDEVLMKRVSVGVRYRWLDGLSGRELLPWTELNRNVLLASGHQEAEAERVFGELAQALVRSLERGW